MKTTILRVSGTTVVMACSLLLPAGIANAQSIDTTGPDSTNVITDTNKTTCTVKNDNDVDVTNNNPQDAHSGNVNTNENTTVGSVTSGDATNSSDTSVSVNLTNGGCAPSEVTTPTPVVNAPEVVVSAPAAPAGGMGGGEQQVVVPAGQQVLAPVGGVGAGSGGPSFLATIASVTVASTILLAARIRRQFSGLLG
jgi:hypothetical protein